MEKLDNLINNVLTNNQLANNPDVQALIAAIQGQKQLQSQADLKQSNNMLEAALTEIVEKDKRYAELIETAKDIMYEVDGDGNITYTNERATELFGYSPSEFLGKKFWIFCRPDKSDQIKNIYVDYAQRKKQSAYLEIPVITKNMEVFWLGQSSSFFYNSNGALIKTTVVARDITRRKQNDERLTQLSQFQKSILNSSALGIFTTNKHGKITSVNKGMEQLLGFTADEFLREQSIRFMCDTDHLIETSIKYVNEKKITLNNPQDILVHEIKNGAKESDEVEWIFLTKNRNAIIVELDISPLRDAYTHYINGYVYFVRNITNRKQVEKELLAAKLVAERASNAKNDFLANMSHEIRTPLNGVVGYTELLLTTNLNDVQKQYMAFVHQSSQILLDTVNDILDFAKVEAGKVDLILEPTNLSDLCERAIDLVGLQAKKKKLELILDIEPHHDTQIKVDAFRLSQVLNNLLSNAIKFTTVGEIKLKVEELEHLPNNKVQYRFSVKDSGIGIAQHNQQRIFRVFEQEDISTTKKFGGTGLGLNISSNLLKLMGSELKLNSKLKLGSTFYFDVCFETDGNIDLQQQVNSTIKTALLIEDNYSQANVVRKILIKNKIDVTHVGSGFEAIELIMQNKQYDVFFVDQHMPNLNGFATAIQLKERYTTGVPNIVLLSSSVDVDNLKKEFKRIGVEQIIRKPIRVAEVLDILKVINVENESKPIEPHAVDAKTAITNEVVTILIAEDNNINMTLAKAMLKSIVPNAEIYQAKNGKEAEQLQKQHRPQLILMDIQMPEMNGIEATQKIRSRKIGADVAIIALTAGIMPSEKNRCFEAGMNDYISKPFSRVTLTEMLQKWLP
jgi:PAS domain S-box-containing protein